MKLTTLLPVAASVSMIVAGCWPRQIAGPVISPHAALSRPTNPGPGKSPLLYDAHDFEEARAFVRALPSDVDYAKVCVGPSLDTPFYWGEVKFACHLREHPQFVLLFAQYPDIDDRVLREPPMLRAIRDESAKLGRPITVVPVDSEFLEVPCADPYGALNGLRCSGFLEPWLDAEAYAPWRGLHELRTPLTRIATNDDVVAARAHASVGALSDFFQAGGDIGDLQGFIGLTGDERGLVILTDPSGVVAPAPGAKPIRIATLDRLHSILNGYAMKHHGNPMSFTAGDFAPARDYVVGRGMAFDYRKECLVLPDTFNDRLIVGTDKYVCHLSAHPEVALLLAKDEASEGAVRDEPAALATLRAALSKYGQSASVVPTNDKIFNVPCAGADGTPSRKVCVAFLEPWFDETDYVLWQWWVGIKQVARDYFMGDPALQIDRDSVAMDRLCESIEALHVFLLNGGSIRDPQGYIGLIGRDRGRLIFTDPEFVRAPAGVEGAAPLSFITMRTELCGAPAK